VGNAVRGKGAHLPEDVFRKNPVYKGVLAGWSWMTELRAMWIADHILQVGHRQRD
jgi:hypothetical protein